MAKRRRISLRVMALLLFILVTTTIVVCGVRVVLRNEAPLQHNTTSSSEEGTTFSSEEDTTSSPEENNPGAGKRSPCIHPPTPVTGTVNSIVKSIGNRSNNYVSLVRFIINVDTVDEVHHNQTLWHWAVGERGKFLLSLPYDNHSLSSATLKFGIHSVSITLNGSILDSESFSDTCLVNTLFDISRQVRSRVQTPYSNDIKHDVICKELDEPYPNDRRYIPGYSLFQLQGSTFYKCWNNRAYLETAIHCTIFEQALVVTYPFIFLAVAYTLWCIYAGALNHQTDKKESVNILRINLIPSLFGPYSPLAYAILFFLLNLVIFLWHVCRSDEYKNRSNQRGEKFQRDTWVLDFILANILYLLGLLVLYMYISWSNNDGHVLEKPYNLATKKTRIACYAVVFILCFFRLSATIILFVEIIFYTVIGIIININYLSPIWINVIIAVLLLIAIIRQFFDKYQTLYNNIYSVGRKVDEEYTFTNKIFEQSPNHENGASQRQFKIKSSLLTDIVERRLPLSGHIFNAIKHIIIGFVFIGGVALIVYKIDQQFRLSLLIEYVITIVSLLIGATSELKGNPLKASGKEKNRAQDEFIQLEANLIHYARTGEFPQPEALHWRSFFRHESSHFSNSPEWYQDDEYELLEGDIDSLPLYSSV